MTMPKLPAFDFQPKPYTGPSAEEVLKLRREFLNPALFLYYKKPLMLVEGKAQYVFDEKGSPLSRRPWGDCHGQRRALSSARPGSHPAPKRNVAAFHHDLPPPEHRRIRPQSGVKNAGKSEGLLLREFRLRSDRSCIADGACSHGEFRSYRAPKRLSRRQTCPRWSDVTAHSNWKFNVPHSFGVHHAITPDPYRGQWNRADADAGKNYAADVKSLIDYATSGRVAGFISETIQGVGGCVVYPDGYLKHVYEHVRGASGLCVADEVQTGFGRTGTHFWGFETQGVIPDIVTMAKGIGNGCPLAAVVTTPEIAAALTQRVHFNTFGGNPVVCAQGNAVLEVIEREKLQANSLKIGGVIMAGMERLKSKHGIVGDVRGKGLLLGMELVKDRATKEPAKAECAQVVETCRDLGLLVGKGGLWGQTIRIAPPMCLTEADAAFMIDVLDAALSAV